MIAGCAAGSLLGPTPTPNPNPNLNPNQAAPRAACSACAVAAFPRRPPRAASSRACSLSTSLASTRTAVARSARRSRRRAILPSRSRMPRITCIATARGCPSGDERAFAECLIRPQSATPAAMLGCRERCVGGGERGGGRGGANACVVCGVRGGGGRRYRRRRGAMACAIQARLGDAIRAVPAPRPRREGQEMRPRHCAVRASEQQFIYKVLRSEVPLCVCSRLLRGPRPHPPSDE